MTEKLTDQELSRRKKMADLQAKGIDPFGQAFTRTSNTKAINDECGKADQAELEKMNRQVIIAGRIMTKRAMGKIGFMHLQDRYGQIQILCKKELMGEDNYALYKASDLGDIVGVEGTVFRTDSGELSVLCAKYTHLTKALRPLPEKFHGLTDKEERFRRRYLDLISNEKARNIAFMRPKIIRAIQHYFDGRGLVEVETPVLQPILGGANARPFVTHHNALDKDFYLRIATELPLKRLIVGGMEGVYEIGRLFRNEGMDTMHNPEFTTVEAYIAYSDLEGMMTTIEELISGVAMEVLGTTDITYQNTAINLKGPYRRLHMVDAVKEYAGVDLWNVHSDQEAVELALQHNIQLAPHEKTYGHVVDKFFGQFCEDKLIQPTFVYGHPLDISPLAKIDQKDPRFTQRYELFIDGHEYVNAFSELNDPIDQRQRFENQLKEKNKGNDEASEMDVDYVEALEYGLPPTGGLGMGVDRLVMLLTDADTIREVLLFPTMKPLDSDKKIEKAAAAPVEAAPVVEEKIDFSNVVIEPLFEEFVDFETFSKSDFRAVKVLECEAVPKSKKLLKFTLDDGTGVNRTILSGIHAFYEPEELVGKTLIAITNLPPRPMMGIESCGMLLSAINKRGDEEELHLLMVDNHIPAGAKLY